MVAAVVGAAEPAPTVPATLRCGDAAPGAGLDYLLYLPDGYARDTARRWPLVVFLHGIGERGVEAAQLRRVGLPRAVERRGSSPATCCRRCCWA